MNKSLNDPNTISILGCGWFGLALAKHLQANNYIVKGSTTRIEKLALIKEQGIQPYLINFEEDRHEYDPEFFKSTTLIITIPPKRNSAEQYSFAKKIAAISDAAKNQIIQNVLFISSTAVYANANEVVDESTHPIPETDSGKVLLESEKILQAQPEFKTTILRFAGLVGPSRDPGRFFAGKNDVPNGMAPINLIHLNDCIGITMQIISQNAFGLIINGCAPHHPSKQDFYTAAALRSSFPKPSFIEELKTWKTITSTQTPYYLKYKYLIDNWTDWLAQDKL
ncbi:MAG: SDR family NAD(P)-dependent oxidoreductase [Flavobacterium sp.]|nr:MAG: SDR family NAD(P)-dependent oxidoreductase [Flavobacterium sp.]